MDRPALVNGTAYAWVDITVNLLGVPVAGISAISYSDEQEVEDNFGAGRFPVSRGYGAITTEASITLQAEEVRAIQAAAPLQRLQDIPPFDIIVSYIPRAGQKVTTDLLKNCQFKKNAREPKQGDKKIDVEIPLAISHIIWGS